LVLAGYGIEQLQDSHELLRLIGDVEGVHVLGSVSPDELACLYKRAVALVVPSLTEGFCLPALEAQACGTPVICRPVPALMELVTEADVVAADFSIRSLTVAMTEGVKRAQAQPRAPAGLPLTLYAKSRIASLTLDVYRQSLRATEEQ
jgi:glycosyltransferase involved in cell wall biosynthesis